MIFRATPGEITVEILEEFQKTPGEIIARIRGGISEGGPGGFAKGTPKEIPEKKTPTQKKNKK